MRCLKKDEGQPFAEHLFLELASKKLGDVVYGEPRVPCNEVSSAQVLANAEFTKALHKVVFGSFKKYGLEGDEAEPTFTALRKVTMDTTKETPVQKTLHDGGGGQEKGQAGNETKEVADTSEATSPGVTPSEPTSPDLKTSDHVCVSSGKKDLDGKKAEVCKFGTGIIAKAKVKMRCLKDRAKDS